LKNIRAMLRSSGAFAAERLGGLSVITTLASRKLTRPFAAQAGIHAAAIGSKARKESVLLRDELLAQLTPSQRSDMEMVCLALAAMCKEKAA
jgi:hypothetical protein